MSYLSELNEAQKQAVQYIDGPSLIIAGAGAGKTRVLTYKIVYLIEQGYQPENILALTFTNKAADEMKERIAKLIPYQKVQRLWMGTFHSIFAKILRAEAPLLGYTHKFTIYDTEDAKKEITDIIKQLQLSPENYKPDRIYSYISNLKNNLYTPQSYANNQMLIKQAKQQKIPELSRIFTIYQSRLKKYDAMDFDDLLLNINILFRDYPDVLRKYQKLFQFILVDEYQDTNYAQYIIIKKLAFKHKKLSVVGDDSQSIYSFRGARIENIFNLHKDFKDLKIIKLEQNYRSTKTIVNAANSIIEKNEHKIPKKIYTTNSNGEKIQVIEVDTDKKESEFIVKEIKKLQKQDYNYSDIVVMFRTNAQSRNFESYFRQNRIPYKLFGSMSFYQRREIKDLLAYLRLSINPNDNQSIKRIINIPKRGIGQRTIEKLSLIAAENNFTLWDILNNLNLLKKEFHSGTINKLQQFKQLIELFIEKSQELSVYQFVEFVEQQISLVKYYEQEKDKAQERIDNIQEFLNDVSQFAAENPQAHIDEFLQNIVLRSSEDKEELSDENFVSLMTIHASKGLEFKVVFIVGVEEELIPTPRSLFSPSDLEEERRLFYVAMTRAKEKLYIVYARNRMKWGTYKPTRPSRFIFEIDNKYIESITFHSYFDNSFENTEFTHNFDLEKQDLYSEPKNLIRIKNNTENNKKYTENKEFGLKIGMKVKHNKFGTGVVKSLEGKGLNSKAVIDFAGLGEKTLLLKFAKLTILNK